MKNLLLIASFLFSISLFAQIGIIHLDSIITLKIEPIIAQKAKNHEDTLHEKQIIYTRYIESFRTHRSVTKNYLQRKEDSLNLLQKQLENHHNQVHQKLQEEKKEMIQELKNKLDSFRLKENIKLSALNKNEITKIINVDSVIQAKLVPLTKLYEDTLITKQDEFEKIIYEYQTQSSCTSRELSEKYEDTLKVLQKKLMNFQEKALLGIDKEKIRLRQELNFKDKKTLESILNQKIVWYINIEIKDYTKEFIKFLK